VKGDSGLEVLDQTGGRHVGTITREEWLRLRDREPLHIVQHERSQSVSD
jgi:hypothetical protein